MTLTSTISHLGGLAAAHELYAAGWSKFALGRAVATGDILRVRQGWYCLPTQPDALIRAVRVGGRLSCVSAARWHGLAARDSAVLHVWVPGHAARLRSPDDRTVRLSGLPQPGVVTHWTDETPGGSRFRVDVRTSLKHMATCQSPEWVVAAADSALRVGHLTRGEWLDDIAPLPRRLRRLLAFVDPRSESITESITRFRLAAIGVQLKSQVTITGIGRVDFLAGSSLVIEIDGYEYHSDRERFEADRRRDAKLGIRGYRVLRFSYNQVMHHWSQVRDAVRAAIARGDHRP